MTTYYKATRLDGTDFHSGKVNYATALASGEEVVHAKPNLGGSAGGYLSMATVPTDCTGFRWPCRLFKVVPTAAVRYPVSDDLPNKAATTSLLVIEELPAHEVFGPQGEHVVAILDRIKSLTDDEARHLAATWAATSDAALDAAWAAARAAARAAALDAAWAAALAATWALILRDVLEPQHYLTLTRTWALTIEKVHPDDAEVTA